MATKRPSAEEPEKEPIANGAAPKPQRPSPAEARAMERKVKGAEVRKRYDFGVIRKLRHEKNLTIEQFAKVCGLSYAPVSRIETNLIKPNLDTLDKIAEGLGITTRSLIALAERRGVEQERGQEIRHGSLVFYGTSTEGVEIAVCNAKKGQASGLFETKSECGVVVAVSSGKLQLVVNDVPRDVGPSDVVRFEAAFPHRFVAQEDCSFVVVRHPRR
jgi:transcriptional regulator with XRE-family HTH domain